MGSCKANGGTVRGSYCDRGGQHVTVIFNVFIWLQIWNEINARKLYTEKNPFEDEENLRKQALHDTMTQYPKGIYTRPAKRRSSAVMNPLSPPQEALEQESSARLVPPLTDA